MFFIIDLQKKKYIYKLKPGSKEKIPIIYNLSRFLKNWERRFILLNFDFFFYILYFPLSIVY